MSSQKLSYHNLTPRFIVMVGNDKLFFKKSNSYLEIKEKKEGKN